MAGVIDFYIIIGKTLSSHMKQLSENINSEKHRIYYFDQTSKMIVNLGDKKGVSNYESSSKLADIQNSLLMSIVYTTEKDISHSKKNKNILDLLYKVFFYGIFMFNTCYV